ALIVFMLTILFSKNTEKTMYTNFNMMTTMLLGGFWNGASVRFIVWGALHGLALAVNKVFAEYFPTQKEAKWTFSTRFIHVISVLLTFNFVAFCWIFFRAGSFDLALDVLNSIQQVTFDPAQWMVIIQGYENVFIIMLFGFAWHFLPTKVVDFNKMIFDRMPIVFKAFTLAVTFWVVYATSTSGPQPFIYFQF
ncbi:MAG: MBOAT family protein, partial [Flavobacterium sp.]|nr:MBOAT family protein [Flavobacterium sp.]